jgi:predicted RNA-binding Zn-ribbon protein involved in translation (DUF1610 family)
MLRCIQPAPAITATSTACPQCGEIANIRLVEPDATLSDNEKHTFICSACGLPRTYVFEREQSAIS